MPLTHALVSRLTAGAVPAVPALLARILTQPSEVWGGKHEADAASRTVSVAALLLCRLALAGLAEDEAAPGHLEAVLALARACTAGTAAATAAAAVVEPAAAHRTAVPRQLLACLGDGALKPHARLSLLRGLLLTLPADALLAPDAASGGSLYTAQLAPLFVRACAGPPGTMRQVAMLGVEALLTAASALPAAARAAALHAPLAGDVAALPLVGATAARSTK